MGSGDRCFFIWRPSNLLSDERKRRKIFNYIKRHTSGTAVMFLQDTHSTKKHENVWKYQWHGDTIFSDGTSGSRGVCVAFRYNLEDKLLSPEISDKRRQIYYFTY